MATDRYSGRTPDGALLPGPPGLSGAPVAVVDASSRLTAWTDGAEKLTGHPARDVAGRSAARLVAGGLPDDGPNGRSVTRLLDEDPGTRRASRALGDCRRLMRTGRPWTYLLDLRHARGGTVPVRLEAVPLADPPRNGGWLMSVTRLTRDLASAEPRALRYAVLERSPIAMAVWDRDLRCVWFNAATALRIGTAPSAGPIPFEEAVGGLDPAEVEPVLRRVLDQGSVIVDHQFRVQGAGAREAVLSVSLFPLETEHGTTTGVCTVSFDITQSRARQRLALLSRAGKRIGTTLNVMRTAQELADAVVPELADYATVELADFVAPGQRARERAGSEAFGEPAFLRAGLASVTPGAPEAVFAPGERVFLPASSPIMSPLRTGRPFLEPDLEAGAWLEDDPARARAIRSAGMHSAMIVPLVARGAVLGVGVFVRTRTPAPFTRDDLLLAEEFVSRASLSVDNASRYTREHGTALALQRSLLPGRLSGGDVLDVAYRYLPTDRYDGVGGDWCDTIALPGGRIAMVVGDVMGHGINAAAAMGQMRTAVHTLATLDLPPGPLLAGLDRTAVSLSNHSWAGSKGVWAQFATCVYAVYDPAEGDCHLARAGHPPPVVVTPDGRASVSEAPAGAPLGLGTASFASTRVALAEGSTVALFTDGLIESRTEDIDAGLARLTAALERHARAGLDAMCRRVVEDLTSRRHADDDIALLLARVRPRAR